MTLPSQAADTRAAAASTDGLSFGDVLSDLNPLQYLPVIGTIYRAVTGDTIPRPLREAGSLVVSGLMGGPIGIATNLGILAAEKLSGIDVEDVAQGVLAALNPAHWGGSGSVPAETAEATAQPPASDAPASDAPASDAPSAAIAGSSPIAAPEAIKPWTAAQLAAYGIVSRPDGELQQGSLTGADVLNALQLHGAAQAPASA